MVDGKTGFPILFCNKTAVSSPPFRQVFTPLCCFLKTKKTLKPALKRAALQGFIYPADCHLSLI